MLPALELLPPGRVRDHRQPGLSRQPRGSVGHYDRVEPRPGISPGSEDSFPPNDCPRHPPGHPVHVPQCGKTRRLGRCTASGAEIAGLQRTPLPSLRL